jgi:phage gp36-like protein
MAHATVLDLLARYDLRRIGDLVLDTDQRATEAELTGNGLAGVVVQTALSDASGMINCAILAGERYLLADLRDMAPDSKAYLNRICCDIAYGLLISRRGYGGADLDAMTSRAKESEAALEQFRNGDRVFDIEKNEQASLPQQAQVSRKISLFSNELDRYFGMRQSTANELFNPRS